MAKQAKLPQTDWTRGGRDISNTAVPLYKDSLGRLGGYLDDPRKYTQQYLDEYYGANAIQNQDFLRAYNRSMANRTGANWAATGGGYSTSGQRAYDDQQKYYNDLRARLAAYGVNSARSMYNSDVTNELNAQAALNNAYNLGKNYSAIETQNYLADKANKNWWANALQGAGTALSQAGANVPGPWGAVMQGVGSGMVMAGGVGQKDFGSANNGYASIYGDNRTGAGVQNNNTFTNIMPNMASTGAYGRASNWLSNLFTPIQQGTDTQGSTTLTRQGGPTIRG